MLSPGAIVPPQPYLWIPKSVLETDGNDVPSSSKEGSAKEQGSKDAVGQKRGGLKPFVIVSVSYLLYTMTDGKPKTRFMQPILG